MLVFGLLIAAVIELTGVTGKDLRSRAFFDANNVKVGDPLVLTIDFLGEADFSSLHPPRLARSVNRRDWKLDDASARTDTFSDGRRLIYRVRPMREGVLWFPALEFGYRAADGAVRRVKANAIPVHARGGTQVVVEELGEIDDRGLPKPPAFLREPGVELDGEEAFRWRRAVNHPSADAFAKFDFAAARMNEATAAINEGNWARALSLYRRLEWTWGQTPEIERGIVAALALRYDNPAVELPVWRIVGRPLLKYAWAGRLAWGLGGLLAVALLLWLVNRGLRALAVFALVLFWVTDAPAFGLFERMEEEMRQMRQRMSQMSGGSGFTASFGNSPAEVKVKASAAIRDGAKPRVGEPFEYLVSITAPRTSSISQIQLSLSDTYGMKVTGDIRQLDEQADRSGSNVVRRLVVPVRYDVPIKTELVFTVGGMVTGRESRNGGRFSFSFSNSFSAKTAPLALEVRPLEGAPADFTGIVSEGLTFTERPDLKEVGTNDVVTISYQVMAKGHIPADYLPAGAAYEWAHQRDERAGTTLVEYRGYFIADGAAATPKRELCYYDPRTKTYRRAHCGGTRLVYRKDGE